ncbi:MAG: hypothetical protein KIT00_07630 [Rhodospirillales bacterium]|nr:hypothetical protein [Rhodospirillales bacterium]
MTHERAMLNSVPSGHEHILDRLSVSGRQRVALILRQLAASDEPERARQSIECFLLELEAGLTTPQVTMGVRRSDEPASRRGIRVPEFGEKLLHLLLPKETREYLIGDLEEEMHTIIHPKFGPRFAKSWYWTQVVLSILSLRARFLGLGVLALLALAVRSLLF